MRDNFSVEAFLRGINPRDLDERTSRKESFISVSVMMKHE